MALPAVGATVTVTLTGTVLKADDINHPRVLVQVTPPTDDTNYKNKRVIWVTDTEVA
jgi:hypothetical protein